MKIDKLNDEFIVDCTNNSKEERQQVYKFLVDNRNYKKSYLVEDYYPVIVCNKKQNNSNWDSLEKYYNWVDSKKDIPIYTFEQFKQMYLNESDMKIYTIQELRNAPIQIKVYSEEQAIKLAYAAGYYTDWKPFNAKYPIYCYLTECECPSWNPSPLKIKSTIIVCNEIENFMENKKIIGYKLIKPEYRKAVAKIVEDQIDFLEEFFDNLFLCNNLNAFSITNLEKARVLDLWFEKVYEKEKQIVKMYSSNKGEFKIEVVGGKAYYRLENKELPKEFIEIIIKSFKDEDLSFGGRFPYSVKTKTSVDVGCMENCKKSDWENVYKLLK